MILAIALVALIAAPAVISRLGARRPPVGRADESAALAQFGFSLRDVAPAAGLDFVHTAPKLDPKLDPIMPEIASMGAAVSVADFDRDGWPDLYVTNSGEGSLNRLYRNKHDGTFEDLAGKLGVADVNRPGTGVSMGAIWGDYDNDGYEDLFLYKWGRPELFHNEGGHGFTRVTDGAGLPKWVNANSAVWLDYDRDGYLDLFVGGYYPEGIDLWHLAHTRMMPESFEYAKNGGRKFLLRNRHDGTFEDVTARVGLKSRRWALAAAAADLRGTGYPDLIIANDYGVSEYFANEGGKRFREIGPESGIGARPKSGMNVAFGDISNSGRFAIYVSNISEEGVLIQGNNLWVPRPSAPGETPRFDNMADPFGVAKGGWSFGAQFADLNNDGLVDLFLTNGHISASKDRTYWYDFSKVAGGNSVIISDAKNWPPVRDMSHSGYQRKRVWLNEKGERFVDVAAEVGVTETSDGRAVAVADFWNRGVVDVVVAHQKGPLRLYKNTVSPENKWVELELEGSAGNRSAIGAQVRLFWNGQQQLQQVAGASGFCAQNDRRLHFGLGKAAQIDKVLIRWPSGKEQTVTGLDIGKSHHVKEPA